MEKLIGKAEKIKNEKRKFLSCYIIADDNERWHNIWKEVLYDLHKGIVVIDFAKNNNELLKLIEKVHFDVVICDTLEYGDEYIEAKRKKDKSNLEKIIKTYNQKVVKAVKSFNENSSFIFSTAKRELFGKIKSDLNILKPTNGNLNKNDALVVEKLKKNPKLVKLSKDLLKEKMQAYFSSLYDGYFEDDKWFYENYFSLSEKYPPGTYLVIKNKRVLKHFSNEKELDKFLKSKGWTTKDVLVRIIDDLIE